MLLHVAFVCLLSLPNALATEISLPNRNYKFDTNGNLIDAHDGKMYFFEDKYYFYGTSYNCGFRWRTSNYTSPFCGFKAYSSTDLLVWEDEGFLFDASTHYWQTACADTAACFRPKVLNPHPGEYIMWMNSGASNWSYTVFNSSKPAGPYTEIGQPVMPYERGNSSYGNGDFGIHIGPDGDGYIIYDTTPHVTGPPLFSSPNITYGVIQKLTPDYKATEPSYVVTDLTNIEAWDIWYRDGWWYITFGHICGYCDATDTSYVKLKDPLTPNMAEERIRITNSSCGGQHNMVAQLPKGSSSGNSSADDYVYLYGSDLWTGDVNEGKAGSHWEPLRFLPDGSIEPLNCYSPQYTIDIRAAQSQAVDLFSNATVTSAPGNYTWSCGFGIHNHNFIWQFFQAPKSGTVTEFGVNIAQQANDAPAEIYLGEVYGNASDLFSSQGGVKNLYAASLPIDTIGWALPMITARPNVTVEAGQYYAIYMTTTGGAIPYCYLYHETGYNNDNVFQPPTSFMSEIQMGRYPLFPLLNQEMRYYVQID